MIHGPFEFYLHDDFYDEFGNAQQPDMPLSDLAAWPFPSLESVRNDAVLLFDFATAQFNLSLDVIDSIRELQGDLARREIESRFAHTANWHHKGRMLEIAAAVFGQSSAPWFRRSISAMPADEQWLALLIGHGCLSDSEGFELATALIPKVADLKARDACLALCTFNDVRALDWIEANIESPVVGNWGLLAACSGIDWQRLRHWIESGRPRSLAALDALNEIVRGRCGELPPTSGVQFSGQLLATPDEIASVLKNCLESDDAIRVQQRVGYLLAHLVQLAR